MIERGDTSQREEKKLSRRRFLGTTAAAAAAFTIVPRHVLGGPVYRAPSDKLNIACVGIGGKGKADLRNCSSENIVALCDVDKDYAAPVYNEYPNAKPYTDFRKMLDRQKDIDAVIVATPDHTHAVIAMAAMQLGKHVYVQKPLTHDIYEARMLTEAARKYKVATQMGNQGHATEENRLIVEWIRDGAIGDVREVHCWTNRPLWPQGIDRPKETPRVPRTLDWDLWLGPAPNRPYHPAYVPWTWRGWWDFGTGALGDMGCHIMFTAFWALDLGLPTSVEASSSNMAPRKAQPQFGPFERRSPSGNVLDSESAPLSSIVYYQFPARGQMPPVKITWYDGGLMLRRPDVLEEGRSLPSPSGTIFIGDKGVLMCGQNGSSPRLVPETAMRAYMQPPKTIPRSPGAYQEWIEASKGNGTTVSNFDVSGPLTEIALLGNLALRTGQKLHWDGPNMKVTNVEEANQYVRREYRKGWSLVV